MNGHSEITPPSSPDLIREIENALQSDMDTADYCVKSQAISPIAEGGEDDDPVFLIEKPLEFNTVEKLCE